MSDNSQRFAGTRSAHRAEIAEDYCEAIAGLMRNHGEARVRDLASMMGVSHVTVSRTLARLRRDGLVAGRQTRNISLSDDGRRLAEASEARHAVVRNFLISLGVPTPQAETDAEGIEHHVSAETLAAMLWFSQGQRDPAQLAPQEPEASSRIDSAARSKRRTPNSSPRSSPRSTK